MYFFYNLKNKNVAFKNQSIHCPRYVGKTEFELRAAWLGAAVTSTWTGIVSDSSACSMGRRGRSGSIYLFSPVQKPFYVQVPSNPRGPGSQLPALHPWGKHTRATSNVLPIKGSLYSTP